MYYFKIDATMGTIYPTQDMPEGDKTGTIYYTFLTAQRALLAKLERRAVGIARRIRAVGRMTDPTLPDPPDLEVAE